MTLWVRRLFFANIGAFFLQLTMPQVTGMFDFVPAEILTRPWTVVTYMFLHGDIMHILFNMLGLYFFGPQVEQQIGSDRFVRLYFASGIAGALLSTLLAPHAPIIGASAGVFGVMLAFAHYWPNVPIYIWGIIPVPARILVLITTALSLYSGLGGSRGGVADFAHLGGYLGAWLYLRWIERSRAPKTTDVVRRTPKSATRVGDLRAIDMQRIHEVNRDEVNRLLDKINLTGLDSLTDAERVFLSNFAPPDDRKPPVS